MSLKLFRIFTTLNHHQDCGVRIDMAGDGILWYWSDQDDEEAIRRRLQSYKFVAGQAYTVDDFDETDYIDGTLLLFSKRFVERVGNVMSKDVLFFPCKLICDGVGLDWYVAKIIRRMPIIDKEASTYRTLVHGDKVINLARYRKDIEEPFYIARDAEYGTYFIVSELFRDLCKENGLLIEFMDPEPSWLKTKEPKKPARPIKEGADDMVRLKDKMLELVQHLNSEKIIRVNEFNKWSNQTFEDIVLLLRRKLQETYPQTKLMPQQPIRGETVHYANGFPNEKLKQSAFVLSEIEEYLNINKFLDHDEAVDFFNNKITSKGFVVHPTALVKVMIESLLMSRRED